MKRMGEPTEEFRPAEEPEGMDLLSIYLEEIKSIPPVDNEEELVALARAGDARARDRLTEGCLMHAMTLLKPELGGPVNVMELIGTANLALVKAVRLYLAGQGKDGASLKDTVTEVVTEELRAFSAREKESFSGERELAERVNRLTEVSRVLAEQLGREPKEEELAERMRIPAEEVRTLMKQAMQAL